MTERFIRAEYLSAVSLPRQNKDNANVLTESYPTLNLMIHSSQVVYSHVLDDIMSPDQVDSMKKIQNWLFSHRPAPCQEFDQFRLLAAEDVSIADAHLRVDYERKPCLVCCRNTWDTFRFDRLLSSRHYDVLCQPSVPVFAVPQTNKRVLPISKHDSMLHLARIETRRFCCISYDTIFHFRSQFNNSRYVHEIAF